MRVVRGVFFLIVVGGCQTARTVPGHDICAPAVPTGAVSPKSLVLQENEGERRDRIGGNFPFIIKVDRLNGGSRQLVMGYEDVAPGQVIPPHRHLIADEIIFVHRGSGVAILGQQETPFKEGATVYIPRDTRVSLRNTGSGPMTIAFFFSGPGFEQLLRDVSVREGEPPPPFSPAEAARLRQIHSCHVVYE
jgi:quercetin dioxygenase-like cupin family protein